ncbi:hypothetical protein SAMN02949497_4380 [Methylomagnum ishizawai]|uniref:Uncharacterized protein n=1 Tax=Methylomagnum ishizawai TaxID=1760988 RepID=A0A1Y6D303_9GAMM|nr:hypothetical protein [Methylomagnum ishizawai]SMF96966.1 hypothetical protein SAMN02949497_4380 [Methylomagnum ishizawai]
MPVPAVPLLLQAARIVVIPLNPAAALALSVVTVAGALACKIATQKAPLKRVRVGDFLDAEFQDRDDSTPE